MNVIHVTCGSKYLLLNQQQSINKIIKEVADRYTNKK